MSDLSLVERARLGQGDAIAALMNASLQNLGIRARAALQGDCLHVLLEAPQPPAQLACVEFIQQGLAQLQRVQARSAIVYGRVLGQTVPSWVQQIQLQHQNSGMPEVQMPATLRMATITIPEGRIGQDPELIELTTNPPLPTGHCPNPAIRAIPAELPLLTPRESSYGLPGAIAPATSHPATSQLIHIPRRVPRKPSHLWPLAAMKAALKNDRLFLALLLGVPLLIVWAGSYGLQRYGLHYYGIHHTDNAASVSSPSTSTAQSAAAPQPDKFDQALQQASAAVELSHYSRTKADWQQVAQEWQGAIAQMKALPPQHPKYAIAQTKAQEYQRTLDQLRQTKLAN